MMSEIDADTVVGDKADEEPYDVGRGSFPSKSHNLPLYRMSDHNYHQLVLIHPPQKMSVGVHLNGDAPLSTTQDLSEMIDGRVYIRSEKVMATVDRIAFRLAIYM